jgi:FixJ family two-component response regulator
MENRQSTIYVIDDDESIRRSFERLLQSANMNVETFSSPDEFLRSPVKRENAGILMDIRLPGKTGFDLQQKLGASGISIPIIVISASDDWQIRENAMRLGAVAFFRKPVDDQALLDAILWAISGAAKKSGQPGRERIMMGDEKKLK